MYKTFFLLILTLFSLRVVHAEEKAAVTPETSVIEETYKSSSRGYTFQYPSDWTKNEEMEGFDIFIMAPKDDEGRSFANVSIISGELPKDVDLQIYYKKNIQNLLEDNPTIHIKNSGETEISGFPTIWIRYTRDNDQIEIVHYFFVVNGVGFLITTGAAVEKAEQYSPILEHIAKSFRMSS